MPLVNRALLVTPESTEALVAPITAFAAAQGITLLRATTEEFLQRPTASLHGCSHVVALVDDAALAPLLQRVCIENISLGFLPLDARSRLYDWFQVPRVEDEALALAFDDGAIAIDILRCNDELALGSVMLGETPFLSAGNRIYRERRGSWLRSLRYTIALLLISVRNLFAIHPFPITLTTGKDKVFKTAITGLVVIENDVNNAAARLLNTTISVQDDKVSIILIAPKSVMEYLAFLFTAVVRGEQKVSRLPTAISYIKSSYMKIESPRPLRYLVDGRKRTAEFIELDIQRAAVRMNLSPAYHAQHEILQDDKDTVKIENLPTNEARVAMIQRSLPLFTHAPGRRLQGFVSATARKRPRPRALPAADGFERYRRHPGPVSLQRRGNHRRHGAGAANGTDHFARHGHTARRSRPAQHLTHHHRRRHFTGPGHRRFHRPGDSL